MKENKTIKEALQEGKARLKLAGKENYAFEAELLLMDLLSFDRVKLLTEGEKALSLQEAKQYEGYLLEREANRPLQYILGHCEFMGLPFFVGEGVLVPRSETEGLVEEILAVCKNDKIDHIIDIGTGSGCIPICLAHYGKKEVWGVDISPSALEFARKNAQANKVDVTWIESDLFSKVSHTQKGRMDAIVSNPPYIVRDVIATLMPEVREFEPMNALDGGIDGLDFYRKIVEESCEWLRDGGWLFFEIGYDQGQALLDLMAEAGFCDCTLRQDLAGLDRVVFGKLEKKC